MDHSPSDVNFSSEFGVQLLKSQSDSVINPQGFKQILQREMYRNPLYQHVENILTGQQGARHFLNIISDNSYAWYDVFSFFKHTTQQVITCKSCLERSLGSEIEHFYHELPVPPNKSKLKNYLQRSFNDSDMIGSYRCENGCYGDGEKKSIL